jgi:hypothetical protein
MEPSKGGTRQAHKPMLAPKSLVIAQKVSALNHISGHKAIYNRAIYAPEKRAALERWADHVQSLLQGIERKIVAFPSRPV